VVKEKEETKGDSNNLQVKTNLPPLLVPLEQKVPQRLHWLGVSYGLTTELFKFWKRNGFDPVYLRQLPNEITGEYTCIMIKPLKHKDTADKINWVQSFTEDFTNRFMSLLSSEFRGLEIYLALFVLNPNPNLLANDKNAVGHVTATNKLISYDRIKSLFSDWDLKRLEKYCQNLYDYRLVLDLIPILAQLFFKSQLDIQLNYSQCAILLGIGLQRRGTKDIALQMGMVESQATASLNKALRKMQKYLESVIETYVRETQVEPAMSGKVVPSNEKETNPTVKKNKKVNVITNKMVELRSELKKVGHKKKKRRRKLKNGTRTKQNIR